MGISNDEIITILCKLADSEELKVTSNENSRFVVEDILKADQPGSGQLLEKLSKTSFSQGATPNYLVQNVTENDHSSPESNISSWLTVISIGAVLVGLAYNGLQVFYSRTWKYLFANHEMSVTIQVAPVSSVLKKIPPTDQSKLAQKIKRIMRDYYISNKEALAAEIEKDKSLAREIILQEIEKYMNEDLSMPISHET
ncbi:unnamed protein product [Larinioides sclopetarius]|uniref:Uncharacterized protein n=1 Tax=Larinioides sclopetarius TaxID=280406 RepID=A0AAV1Z3T7_9ARAC